MRLDRLQGAERLGTGGATLQRDEQRTTRTAFEADDRLEDAELAVEVGDMADAARGLEQDGEGLGDRGMQQQSVARRELGRDGLLVRGRRRWRAEREVRARVGRR